MKRLLTGLLVALLCGPGLSGAAAPAEASWGQIQILREQLAPGEKKKFSFIGERSFEGAFIDIPVFVAHGARPGPRLCVTAAIHGDEVNSVEIARRVFAGIEPADLAGTLVVLPAVNSLGFRTSNRYLIDRRDLNRAFPGNRNGSVASIIANAVFANVISTCTQLIDLHTGSNFRTNLPQIRVDTSDVAAMDLAIHFGVGIIVDGKGPNGSLRREAMDIGVPAIIYEAGPPNVFVEPEIELGTVGVYNLMGHLGMTESAGQAAPPKLLKNSSWLRVPTGQGGIYLPVVKLGDRVEEGQLVATVVDPGTDVTNRILARNSGLIVGMALPQVVLSGYGLFNIGEVTEQLD